MPLQAIRQQRLYRQIADQLHQLIERGEFPPGTLLPPERELAQTLGVSRASVREALIALEVIGQVEVRVGHGVLVGPLVPRGEQPVLGAAARQHPWQPDPELIEAFTLDPETEIPPHALLEARRLVEPEAAALAAGQMSEEALAGIRAAFERNVADNSSEIDARQQGQPYAANHTGDRLFHIRIADACGNPAYALLIRHILGHQYGIMFRRLQDLYLTTDMKTRSQRQHREILEALERRDSEGARQAMRAHLDYVMRVFFDS
ncbi:GntR family transcriptional regulator [Kushneria sinocarnis]|uniref:GntR family transcriptional regulator n=1 Tax=Kushneria sinocarnis TaxID=595502 RepID=A0A420X181_9GAMM|nr:FadR/GntR family transcriptional regulator [Kushneria sinocarnis]RKR07603.1 GntR family transcriptional regulator [Kushneria sinocarnis]